MGITISAMPLSVRTVIPGNISHTSSAMHRPKFSVIFNKNIFKSAAFWMQKLREFPVLFKLQKGNQISSISVLYSRDSLSVGCPGMCGKLKLCFVSFDAPRQCKSLKGSTMHSGPALPFPFLFLFSISMALSAICQLNAEQHFLNAFPFKPWLRGQPKGNRQGEAASVLS